LAVTYENNAGAGRSLASLVDDITQIGNSYSYITYAYYNNGAETNDFAAVKAAMVQQVSDYIASLISSQGDSTVPTFDQDHLRSLLTYRYVSYYSYKNNWVDYTQIYYDFIRAYQANATDRSEDRLLCDVPPTKTARISISIWTYPSRRMASRVWGLMNPPSISDLKKSRYPAIAALKDD
jgi:hypothetical protein